RPRRKHVERDLVVAHHHSPEAPAHPEEGLRQAQLLLAALLLRAVGAEARPLAEAVGVDREDDVAALRERLAPQAVLVRRLLPDLLLAQGVLPGVPVAVEDPREGAGPAGDKEPAGD